MCATGNESDMSDLIDDVDDDDTDDVAAPAAPKRNWRRELEQQAEEGRKAAEDATTARLELAFLKAGVDVDSPHGKLFAKAYDGEATVDAVKAAATEYGVIQPDQPAIPADELAAHGRLANAANGATVQTDEQGHLAAIQSAENVEDVLAALTAAGVPLENTRPGRWLNT